MEFALFILSVVTLAYGHDPPSQVLCKEDGQLLTSPICNHFYKCAHGIPVPQDCPVNLFYNPITQQCDWPQNVNCDGRIVIITKESAADNHKLDSVICDEDGQLLPSLSCNQFYKCANGIPVSQDCPVNLLYNPKIQQCDWPHNVNCEDRILPEINDNAGDNDGGDNVNSISSGAEDICIKENSEGKLVPHEDCNKFYICNAGSPVTLQCQLELLYNPLTQQCDWPENVKCEDKSYSNSDEENKYAIEAAIACSKDKSNGLLLPNENCNQFYECSNSLPIAIKCPVNLLYNTDDNVCDWPENVSCGNRMK